MVPVTLVCLTSPQHPPALRRPRRVMGAPQVTQDSSQDVPCHNLLLEEAIINQNGEECQLLLDKSHVDVMARNTVDGSTLLHTAARKWSQGTHHCDVVQMLVKKGAPVNAKDNNGDTPLHKAAQEGHTNVCKHLIECPEAELKINAKNKKNRTPLHCAAQEGHYAVVTLLIQNGADPSCKDHLKYMPLHHAASKGHYKCCKELAKHYEERGQGDVQCDTPILLAAKKGHHYCLEMMDKKQININHKNTKGNTALHVAVRQGFDHFAARLLSMGADLNMQNNSGNTPLMEATLKNNKTCAAKLIEANADLTLSNTSSRNVLQLAASKNSTDCMELILNNNVPKNVIDAIDIDGMTALSIAVQKKDEQCAKMLLTHGASRTAGNQRKQALLHRASQYSKIDMLVELLKYRDLDVNLKNIENNTPLHVAAQKGSCHSCTLLLLRSARVNAVDSRGQTALHKAAHHGHPSVLKLLIKNDAIKDAKDDKKNTALHDAAANGNLECCKVLILAAKILAKQQNSKNEYPITLAFESKRHDVFKYLLENIACNSVKKVPQNLQKYLHLITHKLLDTAVNEKNRPFLQAIIESQWWQVGLGLYTKHEEGHCSNFRSLVKMYPQLAEKVMDKCVREQDGGARRYDFHILEDKCCSKEKTSSSCERSQDRKEAEIPFVAFSGGGEGKAKHPVRVMIKHRCSALLQHNLTKEWLNRKWKSSAKFIFMLCLLQKFLSVGVLICFILNVQNWKQVKDKYNVTMELCSDLSEVVVGQQQQQPLNTAASHYCHIALLLSLVVQFTLETNGFLKMRWSYLNKSFLFVRLPGLVLSSILLLSTSFCELIYGIKTVIVWQCGLVALIIDWFHLIHTFNQLPRLSIFSSITPHFIKDYVKVILYVGTVVFIFAFAFHMLLPGQPGFVTLPQALVKTVVWLRGDLAYDDTFLKEPLDYPILVNVLFLIFSCMVGVFIVTLIKTPSPGKKMLIFYRTAERADLLLRFDACFPSFKTDCTDSDRTSQDFPWILRKFNTIMDAVTVQLNKLPCIHDRSETDTECGYDLEINCCDEDKDNCDHLESIQSQGEKQARKLDQLLERFNEMEQYIKKHMNLQEPSHCSDD